MAKLRDIMLPGFVNAVQTGTAVADAVQTMADRNVAIVAVLSGDRLLGLVSERDVTGGWWRPATIRPRRPWTT